MLWHGITLYFSISFFVMFNFSVTSRLFEFLDYYSPDTEEYGSMSNDSSSGYSYSEEDDNEEEEEEEEEKLDINNLYFKRIPQHVYKREAIAIQNYYKSLAQHKAMIYFPLNDTKEYNTMPSIYINKEQRGTSITVEKDTFIVNKVLDYIYSYLIDDISPQYNTNILQNRRLKKMQNTTFCQEPHDNCPLEFVIYTKKTSLFYHYCLGQMKCINYIHFDTSIVPVSLHLAYFMCHQPKEPDTIPEIIKTKKIPLTEEWVSMPLFCLLLWHNRTM